MKRPASALSPEDLPTTFGRFQLDALLGEGGMGRVFAATLLGPDGFRKPVALKVLHPRQAGDDARSAFAAEARIGAMVLHPNLVETYDHGWLGDEPWIAMEWVRGATLAARIAEGPFSAEDLLRTGAAIAEGLAALHGLSVPGHPDGVVHRDLKPGNVLLGLDGRIKVSDFGLARAFHRDGEAPSEHLRGTPAYMAPEQARGLPLDGRADLFALGSILWEMATGERFLRGDSIFAVVHQLVQLGPAPDDEGRLDAVRPGLRDLVVHLLQPDPDARPREAAAVARDLRRLAAGGRSPATPVQLPETAAATLAASRPLAKARPLPVPRDRFVGRANEMREISGWFDTGGAILSLIGPGGAGKTRLALAAAQEANSRFDEVIFVDLSSARDRRDLSARVGESLQLPEAGRTGDGVRLALEGRRSLLLVLDNTEQIADAPAEIAPWATVAATRLLVTSRVPLAIRGERILDVEPLPVADGCSLFVERAGRGDAADPVIADLVHRLDGLPLAIELAAARARLLGPAQLLERLSDRFRLLQGGRNDLPSRHHTLCATLDWSWDLLGPWERRALVVLARFVGAVPLEAAVAVLQHEGGAGAPWPEDRLSALREWSWLRSDDRGLSLLFSVREYSWSRGDEQERRRASEAHATWWLGHPGHEEAATSEGHRSDIAAQGDRLLAVRHWLDQRNLEAAATVLRGAARLAAETGTQKETWDLLRAIDRDQLAVGLRIELIVACASFLPTGESVDVRSALLNEAWALASSAPDPDSAARAYAAVARFALDEGRLDDAEQHIRAVEGTGARGIAESGVLDDLRASLAWYQGRIPAMLDAARRATDAAHRGGRPLAAADREMIVGIALSQLGRLDDARHHYEVAAREARRVGSPSLEAVITNNLGVVEHQLGHLDGAIRAYRFAREGAERLGLRRLAAVARGNEGLHAHEVGDHSAAITHYAAARAACVALHLTRFEAWFGAMGAGALAAVGRRADAQLWAAEAHDAGVRAQDPMMLAAIDVATGLIEVVDGDPERARRRITTAEGAGLHERADNVRFAIRMLRAELARRGASERRR